MKKIFFVLLCLFCVNVVYADDLKLNELDYYVRLKNEVYNYHVHLKRICDKDTLEDVFALELSRYSLIFNYERKTDINLYGEYYSEDNIDLFNKIVYYYNQNKSELNYIYAQILIWELITNYEITIVDKYNNELKEANELYQEYASKVKDFIVMDDFSKDKYSMELWDTLTIPYKNANILLDNPSTSFLEINIDNKNVYINASKVGNYQVEFNKNIQKENYVYVNNYKNYFWQFIGKVKNDNLDLEVKGINLKIKENVIGINNKVGDAKLNDSKYELYLNNELKLNISNLNDNFIRRNSSYILKDNSNNVGINSIEDIAFNVNEDDYILEINKYVINKNINIDIRDNYTYYVYLKSNNELYETINKDIKLMNLPYGQYYINSKDNDYYYEIEVLDNNTDTLIIDNSIIVEENVVKKDNENEEMEKISNEIILDNNTELNDISNEIILDNNTELTDISNEIILDNNTELNDISNEIINPKTADNIYLYVILFLSSLSSLFILKRVFK